MEDKKTKKEAKPKKKVKKHPSALDDLGTQVEKFATKTAESIKKVIDRTVSSRNTVLSIRVSEESERKLRMLVDAGLFKSRSESAAFLIEEGIKNQEPLFTKISSQLHKIDKIKKELTTIISKEIETIEIPEKKQTKKS